MKVFDDPWQDLITMAKQAQHTARAVTANPPTTRKARAPKPIVSPVIIPPTLNAKHREAVERRNSAGQLRRAAFDQWIVAEHARFVAAGGCTRCSGRGWIVTWDTMDSMSGCYAEYGACPEPGCTEEARQQTGLDLSDTSKYDRLRGIVDIEARRNSSLMYRVMVAPFDKLHDDAAVLARDAEAACRPLVGSKVVVTKGRKVAYGTSGVIAYINESGSGLLKAEHEWKDRKANGAWVDLRNVEVVA